MKVEFITDSANNSLICFDIFDKFVDERQLVMCCLTDDTNEGYLATRNDEGEIDGIECWFGSRAYNKTAEEAIRNIADAPIINRRPLSCMYLAPEDHKPLQDGRVMVVAGIEYGYRPNWAEFADCVALDPCKYEEADWIDRDGNECVVVVKKVS